MGRGGHQKSTLLNYGIQSIPNKLERATWLNYVRCHDDIGLGFDDQDIYRAGYDPKLHRNFLLEYYTGQHQGSPARGVAFGSNKKMAMPESPVHLLHWLGWNPRWNPMMPSPLRRQSIPFCCCTP